MTPPTEGDDHDEHNWGLVMPFVAVTSKGGPYDDDAYTAGYEMGLLTAKMEPPTANGITMTIRSDNRGQADLLAMRFGFTATFTESDWPEWTWAEFRR